MLIITYILITSLQLFPTPSSIPLSPLPAELLRIRVELLRLGLVVSPRNLTDALALFDAWGWVLMVSTYSTAGRKRRAVREQRGESRV
jgi:hypothetical protein